MFYDLDCNTNSYSSDFKSHMQDFILIRITRILWPFSHRVSVVRGPNLLLPVKKMKPMLLAKLLGDSPDITSSRSMFLKSHFLFE